MSQIELKRARLQALARVLSARGKLTLMFGDTPCTDLKNITLRLTEGEIVPGVPATGAECWIAMKASVAHESAHIRFTSKSAWNQATRHSRLMAHLVNIIEDARIERCMSNLYPGTLLWFRFINDYIFLKTRDWETGPKALMGGLICYAVVGRLPAQIEEQSEIAELIYRCAPHIDGGRLAPDTETVCECAREIFSIIHDFLESYAPPPLPATLGSPNPEKAPGGKLDPRRKPSLPKRRDEQPEEKPEMRDEPDATRGDGEPGDNPEEALDTKDYETWDDDHTDNKEHDEEKPKDEPGRESVDDGTGENADIETDESGNSGSGVDSPGKPEPGDDESEPDESTDEPEDDPEAGFDGEETETGGETGEDVTGDDDDEPDEDGTLDDDTDDDLPVKESDDQNNQPDDDLPKDEPDGGLPEDEPDGTYGLPKDDSGDDPDEVPDDDLLEGNPDDDLDESGEDEYIGDSGDDSIDMEEYAKLVDEAGKELFAIESSSSRAEKAEAKMVVPDIDPEDITGELSRDIHRGCEFVLEKDLKITDHSREIYEQIYSNVRPHINKTTEEIRKILEYKTTYLERNLRKGKLHGNSLWKLQAKDPRVFCKVTEPNDIPELSVYLLVDCSGSMNGINIAEARKSACLLYEACSALKIPVNITGFTSDIHKKNDVVHIRFISFNDPQKYGIANINAMCQNRDGYSIRVATRELLLRPEQQKVLIVLSDGMPAAPYLDYRGKTGIRDTALAVREAERQGLGVIGLYFGCAEHLPQAQRIYNNCIYVSDVSVLPQVIGRVLKKVVSNL